MTATTGAWAQSAFTAKEITSASQLTSTDDEAYVAACMPSDFLAVDVDVAKAWTGAPTDGSAILIYAIDGNKIKMATFLNGDNKATTGATWSIATFKTQMANSKFYYTAATYSVTLAEGTEDFDKWTISPTEAAEGSPVTVTYSGERKVKSVKAVKAAKPDLLSGVFSVSSTKKVNFSKGNLRYESSKWSFFDNQYDYYTDYSADAWDKFGWSTSATTYGMNTSTDNGDYSGDFVDWGATMGTGWFTLSSDEWTYLFNTRTVNGGTGDGKSYTKGQSVNGKLGLVIYPDNYTGAVYSGSDWATFESAGCVFLPAAAGYRYGSSLSSPGTKGYYWSATPNGTNMAYSVYFISGGLSPAYSFGRRYGCSVRLVREVATSDAAPAAGKTVDLSTLTDDYEAKTGDVLTGTTSYKVTIAAGATVTLKDVTVNNQITCLGDATIILADGSTNTVTASENAGIQIGGTGTLTINAETAGDGKLTVQGGNGAAGIGTNQNSTGGNIVINGGTVNATGGFCGAGIGAGYGYGTSSSNECGAITINGGTVNATGGFGAAAIGTGAADGSTNKCGTITIGTGVTSVTATMGAFTSYSIGIGGNTGGTQTCGTITIGGVVKAQSDFTDATYTYPPSN